MVKNISLIIYFLLNYYFSFSQNNSLDDIQSLNNIYQQIKDSNSFPRFSFFYKKSSILNTIENNKNKYLNFILIYDKISNNNLPIANNFGSIFPARGDQTRLSIGINMLWRNIDINYQPEIVNAENKNQIFFNGNLKDGNWWPRYYLMVANNIDDFRQFGNRTIHKTFLGQSRVGFKNQIISFGISNENIWMGPGFRNSIILSNNSNGFRHLYLNTTKPISTKFGNLEFYYFNGIIDTTEFTNLDNNIMNKIWPEGIQSKINLTRKLNGIEFVWNPNFAKNLFIGYAVSNMFYRNLKNEFNLYYTNFSKDKPSINISTIQLKYIFPKEHADIYFEVGSKNQSLNLRNVFSDTTKTAFIIGINKFYNINKNFNYHFFIECTQLSLMNPKNIFFENDPFGHPKINSWYTSNKVKQGWTNNGKLLGAFIGPGSNSQTIGVNFYYKKNKFGLFAERILHNADFYHYVYLGQLGYSTADAYYVDLSWGLNSTLKINNNIMFSTSLTSTQSLNYRWFKNGNELSYAEPGFNSDRSNLQLIFSLRYKFNGTN
jgi:hypothetical protein